MGRKRGMGVTPKQAAAVLIMRQIDNCTYDETLGQFLGGWSKAQKQKVYDAYSKLRERVAGMLKLPLAGAEAQGVLSADGLEVRSSSLTGPCAWGHE